MNFYPLLLAVLITGPVHAAAVSPECRQQILAMQRPHSSVRSVDYRTSIRLWPGQGDSVERVAYKAVEMLHTWINQKHRQLDPVFSLKEFFVGGSFLQEPQMVLVKTSHSEDMWKLLYEHTGRPGERFGVDVNLELGEDSLGVAVSVSHWNLDGSHSAPVAGRAPRFIQRLFTEFGGIYSEELQLTNEIYSFDLRHVHLLRDFIHTRTATSLIFLSPNALSSEDQQLLIDSTLGMAQVAMVEDPAVGRQLERKYGISLLASAAPVVFVPPVGEPRSFHPENNGRIRVNALIREALRATERALPTATAFGWR